jgi:hypothetical protein
VRAEVQFVQFSVWLCLLCRMSVQVVLGLADAAGRQLSPVEALQRELQQVRAVPCSALIP